MDAKVMLGRCIKRLREQKEISQEALAEKGGITYQYLSSIENGKENVSIGVLEAIATGLDLSFQKLIALAFASEKLADSPQVKESAFRSAPFPGALTVEMLKAALNETQRIIFQINANLRSIGAKSLPDYIQGNNFSGLVSNLLCDSLSNFSCFKHNSHQAYPDLVYRAEDGSSEGLEIKTTTQVGKGGESHNGHSGWHLIACYKINPSKDILFIHVMLADLVGHQSRESDWVYVGSKVNETTGSRRTETYNTTLLGTTKLRDGTVYLDPDFIDHKRWRQKRLGAVPEHSIFYTAPRDQIRSSDRSSREQHSVNRKKKWFGTQEEAKFKDK